MRRQAYTQLWMVVKTIDLYLNEAPSQFSIYIIIMSWFSRGNDRVPTKERCKQHKNSSITGSMSWLILLCLLIIIKKETTNSSITGSMSWLILLCLPIITKKETTNSSITGSMSRLILLCLSIIIIKETTNSDITGSVSRLILLCLPIIIKIKNNKV